MKTNAKIVLASVLSALLAAGLVLALTQRPGKNLGEVKDSGYFETTQKDPFVRVTLGDEWPEDGWRIKDALRLDVIDGLVYRDQAEVKAKDLGEYVDLEARKIGAVYLIIRTPDYARFGDVIAIADKCRKCQLKAIIINMRGLKKS